MSDDILDSTPAAPAKKKAKAKVKAKPAKAKAKTKAASDSMGRPPSAETAERRKKVLQAARAKNGVSNIVLAEKLGVTTAQSQSVCRPLVVAGELKMKKDKETGRVVYVAA